MNLSTLISRHAIYYPDNEAVILDDLRLTWSALNQGVNQLANALLDAGIQKDDKIAMLVPNCIELINMYLAVGKIGAVIVPLSPLLRGAGLARLVNDSDATMLFAYAEYTQYVTPVWDDLPNITDARYIIIGESDTHTTYDAFVADASTDNPPYISINIQDPFNIFYSSGTTGLPKGIVHSHYVRMMYGTLFANNFRIHPESVVLHVGALIFNGAMLTFFPAMYLGSKYIFTHSFDAEATIELIEREQVTHLIMVPSQIVAILNAPNYTPEKLQSLEMLGTVGAPLLMEQKQRLMQDLPNRFYELYGLTEGFVTILDRDDAEAKPQSVGVPPPFYEMRIVDAEGRDVPVGEVGEIIGRGPILMSKYYKRPDLTQNALRDNWLYSGDLGYVDEDGYLYLVDRKKDMIISGGVNVYPRDIEEIIARHDDVLEVAVFGVPDEKWGETPVAAIIADAQSNMDADAFKSWINDHVEARFQKVSRVILRDDFPRSAAGKTLKRTMREEIIADLED
ncbi:MAG: AMP-binding protein [Chloroflexota bacterium]